MNKAVKVLSLISYKFLPPDMGGQKGIAFFNRYLSKETDLACVTIKSNKAVNAEDYAIQAILSNSSLRYINPFYLFTIRRIIRKKKITHLLIEHPYYGWLAILLKWFCKVKFIVHSHNIESLRFKSMGKWWWGILWHYEKFVHSKANISFFIHDNDREYAIQNFKLDTARCITITYGFETNTPPGENEKKEAKDLICKAHNISPTEKILLFNGTLDYKPNLDALDIILNKINPLLVTAGDFHYKIIICGNKLPAVYKDLTDHKEKNIIYAGFVGDINVYFKGADIFINPVTDGGGIKTKVVEALGYGLSVVSTDSGAIGIPAGLTGDKMKVIADTNLEEFTRQIISMKTDLQTPPAFFDHFYWGNIASKAASAIRQMV
jgi:glycosyltransferase involved in cell wall biosynthesis